MAPVTRAEVKRFMLCEFLPALAVYLLALAALRWIMVHCTQHQWPFPP